MSRSLARALLLAATLGLLPLGGCEDGGTGVGGIPNPSLENLWPNEDGRAWLYGATVTQWDGDSFDPAYLFDDPADVPEAPAITSLAPRLDSPVLPDTTENLETTWRIRFEGMTLTDSGMSGQNLVEELEATSLAPVVRSASSRVLARIARARPDLRPRIEAAAPGVLETAELGPIDAVPIFLHGGAWVKTEDLIGGYGDLDTLLAWKYLEKSLLPGHQFTHQLVPSLAPEIFLHGWVRRAVTVETAVGTFARGLEVVYLVDYGTLEVLSQGSPSQYTRYVLYGSVIYVPTVGPVAATERDLVPVGANGLGMGTVERSVELIGVRAGGS